MSMKIGKIVGLTALLAAVVAPPVPAQGPPRAQRRFNPATVETVSGTVARIERTAGRGGGAAGVHLIVNTGSGELPVHLGPAWFVDKQPVHIAAHDKVDVRGSRITDNGAPALVAITVTRDSHTLRLRNDDGTPLWAGRGRRRAR